MRLASVAGCVALGMALQGCGAAMVRDDWLPHPTHPALKPHHVEVAGADLQGVCGAYPGVLYGCALRVPADGLCIIFTGPRPAAWVMAHERRHCDGWDHGPFPLHIDARVAAAERLGQVEP